MTTILVPTKTAYWNDNFELTFYLSSSLSPEIKPISCAFVLAFDKNKNMILGKHAKRGWDLPGGKSEKGETPEQTACRETKEEIGLTIEESSLKFFAYENVHDSSPIPLNPDFPFPDNYFIYYIVKNVDNTKEYVPRETKEGEKEEIMKETRWFSESELREHKWFVNRPGLLDVVLNLLE